MSSTFDLFAEKLHVTREQLRDALIEHVIIALEHHTSLYHPEDDDCDGPPMTTTTRYPSPSPDEFIIGVGDPTDPRQRAVKLVKITVTPIDDPVTS